MATKAKSHNTQPRKRSKREKRQKLVIYIMIIAMLLSTITMGLAYFINF
ncbi:stressosome-associated protein Prli42 [Oceanobacillus halophilus]|nr:stressosome-associated protein Prli42 [Oceanobacillus halophilus]